MAGNNYPSHPVYTILMYWRDVSFLLVPWIAQSSQVS